MKLYKMHGVLFQVQLLRSLTFFHLESLKDNLIPQVAQAHYESPEQHYPT